MKKKVVVAMSGGVDSSVAAALLVREGFDVIGLFMKLWSDPNSHQKENKCCDLGALADARRTAAVLGIPFYVINLEKEFRQIVVDNFLSEYAAGRTPNPCVICNREIKFDLLYRKARALGADYLATGHYVRVQRSDVRGQRSDIRNPTSDIRILRAKDRQKDQSYMLWAIKKEILPYLLFPIGDPPAGGLKTQVRQLAKKWRLPSHSKPESQEICFVAREYRQFLQKYIPEAFKIGPIKDRNGRAIGQHQGLPLYTVGQRKGLGELITHNSRLTTKDTPPLYVVALEQKTNSLIVGQQNNLYKKELIASEVNWLDKPVSRCQASIRYGHLAIACRLSKLKSKNEKLKIIFQKPVRAITPGQSVVFYQGEQLLGGGVIA